MKKKNFILFFKFNLQSKGFYIEGLSIIVVDNWNIYKIAPSVKVKVMCECRCPNNKQNLAVWSQEAD